MQILLGTKNAGKVTEIRDYLQQLPCKILAVPDLKFDVPPPEEAGDTFQKNAIAKAKYYHQVTGLPTIADDSGILVEALQDELGIHTRRWGAGPTASDDEWITYFLERMAKEKNKKAQFVCCIAYMQKNGNVEVFEGYCHGTITENLDSQYLPGLPLSGCFLPNGYTKVYSALPTSQKNEVSHRGKALQKLQTKLTEYLV